MFNGTLVGEWTGLSNFDVKKVMDRVRERMGGDVAMDGMPMEEIRSAVEQANVELGFTTMDRVEDVTDKRGKMEVKDLTPTTN